MILDEIIAGTKLDVAQRRASAEWHGDIEDIHPSPRGLIQNLRESEGPAIIAEIKRKSPSRGDINPGLDPSKVAKAYEENGARAISVLTDARYFGGSLEDLKSARDSSSLPVLRKDFIVDPFQIYEAAHWQADAVLLIVAALDGKELKDFFDLARELALDVLVEVHSREELDRAATLGAELIGVNNRNLKTMKVDPETSLSLCAHMPQGSLPVCESGLKTPEDIRRAWDVGYRAFLIGQALGEASDSGGLLHSFSRSLE